MPDKVKKYCISVFTADEEPDWFAFSTSDFIWLLCKGRLPLNFHTS